jgi:transposase-like protein/DDE family transposase
MQDVLGEFEELVLPDERLSQRVRRFVESAWRSPAESLPRMLQDVSQLEGAYRLLNNARVTFEALQAPHAARTAARAHDIGDVVVVHDTTEIETPYLDESEASYLKTGRMGYQAHISLAVALRPGGPARPLGVLSAQADFQPRPPRSGGPKQSRNGWATARSKDKAYLRWFRGIEASAEALEHVPNVVHVADREADSYPLFSLVLQLGHGCVIRLRTDRRAKLVDDGVDEDWSLLGEIAAEIEGNFERTVPLSKRGNKAAPAQLKTHPPRESRGARLHYGAVAVELKRPHYQPASLPESLELSLVRVWEPAPPEGEAPVEWLLLTTEPCKTPEEIMRVVDLYRARWVIEEFFKALKTGCAIESRQFETRHALLNTLALFLPIAVHLLWLRTCARDIPDAPATQAFTRLQLEVLRHTSYRKLPPNPTVLQAMWSLAGLGGHIPGNGWPGWQVLGRAFVTLVQSVRTWQIATQAAAAKM